MMVYHWLHHIYIVSYSQRGQLWTWGDAAGAQAMCSQCWQTLLWRRHWVARQNGWIVQLVCVMACIWGTPRLVAFQIWSCLEIAVNNYGAWSQPVVTATCSFERWLWEQVPDGDSQGLYYWSVGDTNQTAEWLGIEIKPLPWCINGPRMKPFLGLGGCFSPLGGWWGDGKPSEQNCQKEALWNCRFSQCWQVRWVGWVDGKVSAKTMFFCHEKTQRRSCFSEDGQLVPWHPSQSQVGALSLQRFFFFRFFGGLHGQPPTIFCQGFVPCRIFQWLDRAENLKARLKCWLWILKLNFIQVTLSVTLP